MKAVRMSRSVSPSALTMKYGSRLLDHLLGGLQAVAQVGGPLELEVVGRLVHLPPQVVHHAPVLPLEEAHHVIDDLAVGRVVDQPDAGRRTALDVEIEAGPW